MYPVLKGFSSIQSEKLQSFQGHQLILSSLLWQTCGGERECGPKCRHEQWTETENVPFTEAKQKKHKKISGRLTKPKQGGNSKQV